MKNIYLIVSTRGIDTNVDKLRILKEFKKLALSKTLKADEIGLYLLLLANSRKTRKGEIAYRTIKNALGKGFSPSKLQRACHQLQKHRLIEVILPSLDEIPGKDFTLAYKVFSFRDNQK